MANTLWNCTQPSPKASFNLRFGKLWARNSLLLEFSFYNLIYISNSPVYSLVQVPVKKNCQNPHKGVLVKNHCRGYLIWTLCHLTQISSPYINTLTIVSNIYWEQYKIDISQYSGSKYLNLIHKKTEGRILGSLEVLPSQTVTLISNHGQGQSIFMGVSRGGGPGQQTKLGQKGVAICFNAIVTRPLCFIDKSASYD